MTEITVKVSDRAYNRIKKISEKLGKPIHKLIQEVLNEIQYEKDYLRQEDPFCNFEGFESDAPPDLSMNVDDYLYGKRE